MTAPLLRGPPQVLRALSKVSRPPLIPCTLIPGDGVGPELVHGVQQIFKAADVPISFEQHLFSEVEQEHSESLEDVMASIRKNKICLNGVLKTPDARYTGDLESLNMKLRKGLDLYANVVHVMSWIKTQHDEVDFMVIREQTEGEYMALEHESVRGIVESLKITTRGKSMRIAKFAFDYATKNNRKKVTCVHKANIMKLTDGLFLRCCQETAKLYPRIKFDNMIVDNCAMQMCSAPQQFDVLVTPNLYGNLMNNIGAGLVGGAGIVPGALYSDKCVIFEPGARHTFDEAAGKNVANPTAMILCGVNMLTHVNLRMHSAMIRNALEKVVREEKVKTQDLGGSATTQDFTSAVINNLRLPNK